MPITLWIGGLPMSNYYGNEGLNNSDVDDHLVFSILVTIFCCLPFGIPAIVFSALAKGKKEAGDYAGAKRDADKAQNWCIAAVIAGILGILISIFSRY